jgi:alcohol dehydrogenase class IV
MRSPLLLPKVAIIDPLVGLSMPKELTAATGMDALTQLIEAYVSPMGNPLTDSLCREGIQRAARSLLVAYHTGDDRKAREDMALAALFSGMALTNAKLGAVHGIAGPLGGMLPIPHGVICARLLPLVMRANLKALKKRQESTLALERYTDVARLLTGNKEALAADGAAWVESACDQMNISGLSQYGVDQQLIANLVPKAQKASSMRGNPIELTVEELTNILMAAGG